MNSLQIYIDAYKNPNDTNYEKIVTVMFHELVTKRQSPLLSNFFNNTNFPYKCRNFKIGSLYRGVSFCPYDICQILAGLNIYFSNADRLANQFSKIQPLIFKNTQITNEQVQSFIDELQKLDDNLGSLCKLEEIANRRLADDAALNDEIKKLQQPLQDALKKISEIRDGIDYNTLAEPINQMIQLFEFVHDSLRGCTDTDVDSREYLITTLNDFQSFILQSLQMLGVEIIDAENVAFDVSKHKLLTRGTQPTNALTVTKILKCGFIYKGKVLAKAEVEVKNRAVGFSATENFIVGGNVN